VGSASPDAAGCFAGVGLHHLADLRAGEVPGGSQAEEDSSTQGDGDAEDQDRDVDGDRGFVGEGEFGEIGDDDGDGFVGQQKAETGAGEREQDGFSQKLADDAGTGGTDGGANGEFMLAGGSTCEKQNGDVAASDEEK
jgi:hypothetical protein